MRLRLITSHKKYPDFGDLVETKEGKLFVSDDKDDCYDIEYGGRVVLPHGVSDEEIKEGDRYHNPKYNCIVDSNSATNILMLNSEEYKQYKKVEILPEQFNYQEIVDLKLEDGDEFDYHYVQGAEGDTVSIFKPTNLSIPESTSVTYTEEEVFDLITQALRECEHYDQMIQRLCGMSKEEEWVEDIKEWFSLNKK
jgi:hypothetical protein